MHYEFILDQIQDLENEELTCRVEMGLSTCPWAGEFTWVNASDFKGTKTRDSGLGLSCTRQEFQRFESFFTKFMSTAKEYSLSHERQRFGLVTETSLLSFLGVSNPETWLIVLPFPACPNCSKVVQEVDDIHAVLKMDDSLVMEVGFHIVCGSYFSTSLLVMQWSFLYLDFLNCFRHSSGAK